MGTDDICYMAVDGREGEDSAVDSLCSIGAAAKDKFGFGQVVVLSARTPRQVHEGVRNVQINRMNLAQYSRFVFSRIYNYTDKPFILIYQDDGFALRPDLWDPEFLNYDYIGAPWPEKFPWSARGCSVGNGGFSLRSRKLCKFCSTLAYPDGTPEDMIICVFYRKLLEENGFKFAPVDIAKKFSYEHQFDSSHDITTSFGFHGKHNVHLVDGMNND
jgi:hypothetical protein